MKNMQGLLDVLHAKRDELNAYVAVYESYDDLRAANCRTQSDMLCGILRPCGVRETWAWSENVAPAAPHQKRYGSLTALITEVGGHHTAILFEDGRSARAEEQRFLSEHETLISEGEVSCRTTSVDLACLTSSLIDAGNPRIAYAFIGARQVFYSISLHDDAQGAQAAMARFDIDYADEVDAEECWRARDAVVLPPGTAWAIST